MAGKLILTAVLVRLQGWSHTGGLSTSSLVLYIPTLFFSCLSLLPTEHRVKHKLFLTCSFTGTCKWKPVKHAFKVVLTFLIYPVQLETRKTGSREETTRGTWPSFHPMLCQVTSTPVSASYQLNLLNFPQKSYKSIENLFNLSKLWSRSVSTFHYVNVDSGIE